MLQPLRVASAPPAAAVTTPQAPPTSTALTSVCAIQAIQCKRKTKRDGASCYVIDVFLYAQPPATSDHAMLSPEWEAATTDTFDRAPDTSIARPYLDVWQLVRSLAKVGADCQRVVGPKCRLCRNVVAYAATMDRGSYGLRRAVLTPILKQREIQELVGTFVAIVVRSQHAPARNAVRQPNCVNEPAIATLLAAFLGLAC